MIFDESASKYVPILSSFLIIILEIVVFTAILEAHLTLSLSVGNGTNQVAGEMCSKQYDAIIIPGGGLEVGTDLPNPWVRARLDAAIKLASDTRYFIVLSRGTTHRPPPSDSRGFPVTEAGASAKYILANSEGEIDPERILVENSSLDTIGNAFFTRIFHCEPMELTRLCVVTSAFHMPRTRAIFDWVLKLDGFETVITYVETEDLGMTAEQAKARKDREIESLEKLINFTIPTHNTVKKLSTFLFTKHAAYNAQGVSAFESSADTPGNENGKHFSSGDVAGNVKSTY